MFFYFNFSGELGLFCGVSVMTILEFIELFTNITVIVVKSLKKRNAVSNSENIK